jgi:hypothetical protein
MSTPVLRKKFGHINEFSTQNSPSVNNLPLHTPGISHVGVSGAV